VIKCIYAQIPEGYEWALAIQIENKDHTRASYNVVTVNEEYKIPNQGSFTKIASDVTSAGNVDSFYITMSIGTTKKLGNNFDDDLGTLQIVTAPNEPKRAKFVQKSAIVPSQTYDNFDFDKMFQWK
jgi:hypothetical protein